jgi:hypothetical protein
VKFLTLSSRLGFALIEMLVAFGVLGIIMMSLINMLDLSRKSEITTRIMLTANSIFSNVQMTASNSTAINNSALNDLNNLALRECIEDPGGAVDCEAAGAEFILHPPTGNDWFSGTTAGPNFVLYGTNGNKCPLPCAAAGAGLNQYPIQAITSFTAECPGLAATCKKADKIFINIRITQTAGTKTVAFTKFKDRVSNGIIALQVSGISAAVITCPLATPYVIGINADGTLVCGP